MGKIAKGSRKGKKAWRANISTDDVDEYFIKATKDALSGGPVDSVANDSLFYVDRSTDIPVKGKIEKHREKLLHVDSVLQSNPFVQPIPSSKQKESKKKRKAVPDENNGTQSSTKVLKGSSFGITDIWNHEGEAMKMKKKKAKSVAAHIPAVEVEPPGCSFNPPFEAHQDALAEAVAIEMKKSYRKELEPEPLPFVAPTEELDEEDKFFLDADADADADDLDNDVNDGALIKKVSKTDRVTRVELNRRARQKERIKAEAQSKLAKKITKEIDCLDDIIKEIAKDDEEKQRKHVRRVIAKQERLKCAPPRLGKHKFEPAAPQVLLSEEITGSLRKLKGCRTLARDCYKSLEKRGLVVPKAKNARK